MEAEAEALPEEGVLFHHPPLGCNSSHPPEQRGDEQN